LYQPGDPGQIPLAKIIREIYVAAGGTHEDWDEFDSVMATEGRCAALIATDHILGNA